MAWAAVAAMMLCGSFLSSTAAMAATVSGGTISFSGPTDFNAPLGLLSKFDGNAGTLTGVTLNYDYNFISRIIVYSPSSSAGRVAVESALQLSSSDSNVESIFDSTINSTSYSIGPMALSPAAFNLTSNGNSYEQSAGQVVNYTAGASASQSFTLTNATSLAAFTASSTSSVFDVYGKTLTGLIMQSMVGNASANQTTQGTASISVLYNYNAAPAPVAAVPEPATWAMMILGMGAVGYAMRRQPKAAMPASYAA